MKRFFTVCVALTMATMPFAVGCDKKAEVKKETTVSDPSGSTTTTETKTVETNKDVPPRANP